jgi:hypothetical protein
VLSDTLDVVVMKRYTSVIGSYTGLWTMMLSAGVLAVLLVLACAGTAAGATLVVDDDGGADRAGMRTVEAAA